MTTYSVPPRVAHVVRHEADLPQVFVMRLPDGPPVVLEGTGAVIWLCAIEGDPDVAGAVSEFVGVDRAAIADDVEAYLLTLVETGFLSPEKN